jgi:hypothetical protein
MRIYLRALLIFCVLVTAIFAVFFANEITKARLIENKA